VTAVTPADAAAAFAGVLAGAADRAGPHGDPLVVLGDERSVLLVEHGGADLFAVRLGRTGPAGRWLPLGRVPAGTVLIGPSGRAGHAIIGRAVPGAVLSRLSIGRLTRACGESGPPAERAVAIRQLARGVDAGLAVIAAAVPRSQPPAAVVNLAVRAATTVAAGAAVRPACGVQWVRISRGAARQEGLTDPPAGRERFCLTELDWLVADRQARVVARPTEDLIADGSLWRCLPGHLARLLSAVCDDAERRSVAEDEALRSRTSGQAAAIRSAARSLDMVARETRARVRLAEVAADPPDLAAFRLAAASLGFSIRAPAAAEPAGRVTDPVQRIALDNGVRTRSIRLDGTWWRRDMGPLLGRREADGRVFALLPARGGYVMADPQLGRMIRLTKATAAGFADHATALFRPVPPGVDRIGALLRFAISGTRRDMVRILLTSLTVALIGLLAPIMTGQVLGNFVVRAQRGLIVEGSLLVIGGAFVAAVIAVVQNFAALRLEGRSASWLQSAVWARLLSLPASFFGSHSTGELAVAALGVSAAQETLSGVVTTATLGLLTGSVNLVLVFFYDVRLALIACGLIAVYALVCTLAASREVRLQRRWYDTRRLLSTKVFQFLTGLPKLRAAAAEDRAFLQWSAGFTRSRALAVRARRVQNLLITFNAVFPLLCSIAVFGIVAGPLRGQVPIAAFLSFYAAFTLLTSAALQFTATAITSLNVVPLLERIKPILVAEPEAAPGLASPGELAGHIELSHVSFRYGDGMPLVLDDVSIRVEAGSFVAVVGPTGCGKSTLIRLLLGFETPTAGSVRFDGQDLARLDAGAVRRQCGVVLQNAELLAGSIKANIIGSSGYSADDAWAAARMAGVDHDIAAMPMGMNTMLLDGAPTLSGGQRQRIMIARALLARPRIILFDEATSALDNPAQAVIADSTRRLRATRIVLAHRLSSVADADRIIVLDQGRIVQQGRYHELLADQDGLFASLAGQQLT
jgi:NHLM bacteriocin system ABC transporter ATP-binding protein